MKQARGSTEKHEEHPPALCGLVVADPLSGVTLWGEPVTSHSEAQLSSSAEMLQHARSFPRRPLKLGLPIFPAFEISTG